MRQAESLEQRKQLGMLFKIDALYCAGSVKDDAQGAFGHDARV